MAALLDVIGDASARIVTGPMTPRSSGMPGDAKVAGSRHAASGDHSVRMTDLQTGWSVVGNDGRRLGEVLDVGRNYVLVSTGRLSENLHVPASAIANVDRETVQLNVSEREAASMGWAQPPRGEDAAATDEGEGELHRHV